MLLFDIGANIGRWSIANATSGATIIAVEASFNTFYRLVTNVASYSNIMPVHFAVTQRVEGQHSVTFYDSTSDTLSTLDKDWLASPSSRFGNLGHTIREIIVPAVTIDELIVVYGTPDLVKVDVEGAEYIVIQSLSKKVPVLCFEWASEWNEKTFLALQHLDTLGFKQFAIQFEDAYTYRPSEYNFSLNDLLVALGKTIAKKDWGMIWAK